MSITDWYFIRHAPVLGAKENMYKSFDEPADLSNHNALIWLARQLPTAAQWHCSPLKRTRQTAEDLVQRKDDTIDIVNDDRLTEQNFGDWYGLSFDKLWNKIEGLPAHNWSILAADTCPPNGEAFRDVYDRAGSFMESHLRSKNEAPHITVTHAGVIRAILGLCLNLSPDQALNFALEPLSITHVQYSPKDFRGGHWRLVRLNHCYGYGQ
ncbi:MAG: histidine phosphatase family protein [Emcibacter sp.]|nr:histidine phosphatase family protein [Emcibacter sp.]